ncbi:hypothetical protein Acr_20g0010030 [Actinidia rufa]|uniref:Uncharacterized protein n=1 Tax=Actinidia rufa TaxID=165716 RepID=A0A7J0GEK5_9ERIC|nr:hypothetical protein Acr_20g0010030 [Actinidia rufa]
MSKKISFKKLGEKVEKSKNGNSVTGFTPAKRVVIGEKLPRDDPASSPSKRARLLTAPRERSLPLCPMPKKRRPGLVMWHAQEPLLRRNPGRALMLGSSLAVRSREVGEKASLQQAIGRAPSLRVVGRGRAAKLKDDRDAIIDKLERSRILVVGLSKTVARAKTFALDEFKSSSDFLGVVEDVVSKYFSERFDFCKRQLRRYHPDLAIDLEGMGLDHDLLAEEDGAGEEENEKEGENEEDGGKDKSDANPLPP